jgi:hypothetical protein
LEKDKKIIIATPNADEHYFKSHFEKLGIEVIKQPSNKNKGSRDFQLFLDLIRSFGTPNNPKDSNIDIKYQIYLSRKPLRPLVEAVFKACVHIHRKFRVARILVEYLSQFRDLSEYRRILSFYNVSMLILDGIGFSSTNVSNWGYAAKGTCFSTTIITNWDHPSTKGYRSVSTDQYLVWGSEMTEELMKYHDIKQQKIKEVGSALFDIYFSPEKLISKENICLNFGLSPQKKTVLFISNSPVNFPHNISIVKYLYQLICEMNYEFQLLVRLHPLFLSLTAKNELKEHELLINQPGIAYSIPRVLSQVLIPDMDFEEIKLSASLINYSDLVICLFSTMQLDACICGKPVINIAFDWEKNQLSTQTASKFSGYIHIKRLIMKNMVDIAYNKIELKEKIIDILSNSSKKNINFKLLERECGKLDGNSARRIAFYIQNYL